MGRADRLISRGLKQLMGEVKLLRNLEDAVRRSDPNNCRKSLNMNTALTMLDEYREAERDKKKAR